MCLLLLNLHAVLKRETVSYCGNLWPLRSGPGEFEISFENDAVTQKDEENRERALLKPCPFSNQNELLFPDGFRTSSVSSD